MRELYLLLVQALLLLLTWIFHWAIWTPVEATGCFLAKKLDAVELALLLGGVARRTRNERKRK